MVRRPISIVAQWLGIALMIPGLLRVPLPQVDLHVIRHHHGAGEVCPQHDHLLRWHPHADESDDVAVLHWHWLLPHCEDAALASDRGDAPVLYGHQADGFAESFWSPSPAVSIDAASGRTHPAPPLDLARIDAGPISPRPPRVAEARPTFWNANAPASSLAGLVRWNC